MGYRPARKVDNIPARLAPEKRAIYLMYKKYSACGSELFPYVPIMILRGNFVKLNDFVQKSTNKSLARRYIIELKYMLSKISPQYRNILRALSVELEHVKADIRYSTSRSFSYTHRSTRFSIDASRDCYRLENPDMYWVSLENLEPWMLEELEFNNKDVQATEHELYLFASVFIGGELIKTNERELRGDLARRKGLEEVLDKYSKMDIQTDQDWVKQKMKDHTCNKRTLKT